MSSESSVDLTVFEHLVAEAVTAATSIEDVVARVETLPGVRAARLAAYVLKSNPPQRELLVQFAAPDGSPISRIVNVADLGQGAFRFNGLRESD